MLKKLGPAAAVLLAAAFAAPAYAVPVVGTAQLCIDDGPGGAAQICVTDGAVGDSDSAANGSVVLVNLGYAGIWTVNVDTGVTNPTAGLDYPEIDISYSHTSTGAGSLFVTFSQVGFDLATAQAMLASVGGTLAGGASWEGWVYYDAANVLGAETTELAHLGPFNATPYSGIDSGLLPADSLFSLTMKFRLTHTGSGISTGDFNAHPTPEPGSLALLGMGLLGLGIGRKRIAR